MTSVSMELSNIKHPLVKSFRFKRDFKSPQKTAKVVVIEANFDFLAKTATANSQFLDLLADLQGLIKQVEERTGKVDRVDICPLQASQAEELRLIA